MKERPTEFGPYGDIGQYLSASADEMERMGLLRRDTRVSGLNVSVYLDNGILRPAGVQLTSAMRLNSTAKEEGSGGGEEPTRSRALLLTSAVAANLTDKMGIEAEGLSRGFKDKDAVAQIAIVALQRERDTIHTDVLGFEAKLKERELDAHAPQVTGKEQEYFDLTLQSVIKPVDDKLSADADPFRKAGAEIIDTTYGQINGQQGILIDTGDFALTGFATIR